MIDSDVLRAIREEVRRQLNVVLYAETDGTDFSATEGYSEDIGKLFGSAPTNKKRPVAHPYGFASRAPRGTKSLTTRIGATPENRIVLAHLDKDRPEIDSGEAVLYGADGQVVFCETGGNIRIGSKEADEPLVLGNQLKDMLGQILSQLDSIVTNISSGPVGIISSPTPGSPVPTFPSLIAQLLATKVQLTLIKTQFLDVQATDILSQKNFTERGGPL